MKGTVLGFDPVTHSGAINGFDGQRYEFVRNDWRADKPPQPGAEVDFAVSDGRAVNVFPLRLPTPVFSWRRFLFSFQGRTSRSQLWQRLFLPVILLSAAAGTFDAFVGTYNERTGVGLVSSLLSLLLLWPWLAVGVKRCHDRNHSGWWLLIGLIPLIGSLWLFVELYFLRGSDGDNRFGADPVPMA